MSPREAFMIQYKRAQVAEQVRRLEERVSIREKLEAQRRERIAQVAPATRERWMRDAAMWGLDLGNDPVIREAQEMARRREEMERQAMAWVEQRAAAAQPAELAALAQRERDADLAEAMTRWPGVAGEVHPEAHSDPVGWMNWVRRQRARVPDHAPKVSRTPAILPSSQPRKFFVEG